jgi:hypothetical protein
MEVIEISIKIAMGIAEIIEIIDSSNSNRHSIKEEWKNRKIKLINRLNRL